MRLIYVGFCEITRAITTKSEHIDHWTKMLRPFALFSGSEPSRHIRSSAGFIITMCLFEFSVHTGHLEPTALGRKPRLTGDQRSPAQQPRQFSLLIGELTFCLAQRSRFGLIFFLVSAQLVAQRPVTG